MMPNEYRLSDAVPMLIKGAVAPASDKLINRVELKRRTGRRVGNVRSGAAAGKGLGRRQTLDGRRNWVGGVGGARPGERFGRA